MHFSEDTVQIKARFVRKLKHWIAKQKISHVEASHVLGLARCTVSHWLKGNTTPSMNKMLKWKEAMREYTKSHPVQSSIEEHIEEDEEHSPPKKNDAREYWNQWTAVKTSEDGKSMTITMPIESYKALMRLLS